MYAPISCLHASKRANHQNIQNRIPIQTCKKWHNVSYPYVSYVRSETSDIWRIGPLFLKPFGERVEENHICDLVKPNSK